MISISEKGCYVVGGSEYFEAHDLMENHLEAIQGTMTYKILKTHQQGEGMSQLALKFDALASHDITYVGIIQTARASGLEAFNVPYVLTNCHNSLAAVGGTINEDDHLFAWTAAKKYGGIYVPPHLAVIHQYMRETMAGVGRMILGSDSHTRYGALGTLAIGEGGGELAKQLMGRTYDIPYPEIVAIYLTGKPIEGVGPLDVALCLIKAVFSGGLVTNKVLEFIGDGIEGLDVEYRSAIDVMTTETACLSSIWKTDYKVKDYYQLHGRATHFEDLAPDALAYYDQLITIDLSKIVPMIAMPFHPSHVYRLQDLIENPKEILDVAAVEASRMTGIKRTSLDWEKHINNGGFYVQQGIIAGCAGGTYHNIAAAERLLRGKSTGDGFFSLSVYPSSQPTQIALVQQGIAESLMKSGAIWRTAFCGPCFGAGDVPNHRGFSIRHTTRNFPYREGAIPKDGQLASVALMDARSIAATAINGGRLTSATSIEPDVAKGHYTFDDTVYRQRVYQGYKNQKSEVAIEEGPNITPWPEMSALPKHLLLEVASVLTDPVTTTDELIPSGETSAYRSNPHRLAQFTLSRKDPAYVGRTSRSHHLEQMRKQFTSGSQSLENYSREVSQLANVTPALKTALNQVVANEHLGFGSLIVAQKPGDGSAREQAASCQKVLGGWANIATSYATKRYKSNLVNWGLLPFKVSQIENFETGDWLLIQGISETIKSRRHECEGQLFAEDGRFKGTISLELDSLGETEGKVLLAGSLINFYQTEST